MALNHELFLVKWLSGQPELKDVPIATDVPATRPEWFISLEQTGGTPGIVSGEATVAVQLWGATRTEVSQRAAILADLLRTRLMLDPLVGDVYVSGPYNFPDLESGHARYQVTCRFMLMKYGGDKDE